MQPLSPATNGNSASRCAWALLDAVPPVNWTIRRMMRSHRKGLSVPQFRTLFLVEREPCASLSMVADFLGSSLPTASRIVGGLVNKGLIQRTGCTNDRRQVSLVLTPRGQSVLTAAVEKTETELAAEVQDLTARERGVIADAMSILRTKFGSLTSPSGKGKCGGRDAVVEKELPFRRSRNTGRLVRV